MREIKFRAWDKNRKRILPVALLSTMNNAIKLTADWQPLSSVEVMQYTGRKDVKGGEIWEGDYLKSKNGSIWEVEFSDGSFGAKLVDMDLKLATNWIGLATITFEDMRFEVIGNIYENPELLEQKEGHD